jgi:hypothetical protein
MYIEFTLNGISEKKNCFVLYEKTDNNVCSGLRYRRCCTVKRHMINVNLKIFFSRRCLLSLLLLVASPVTIFISSHENVFFVNHKVNLFTKTQLQKLKVTMIWSRKLIQEKFLVLSLFFFIQIQHQKTSLFTK